MYDCTCYEALRIKEIILKRPWVQSPELEEKKKKELCECIYVIYLKEII
jgi:hypothetical protein